jgi:hypothetical protein
MIQFCLLPDLPLFDSLFLTENKTAATLAAYVGPHHNQEQWLTLLCYSNQAVSAMLPAVIETLALVNKTL